MVATNCQDRHTPAKRRAAAATEAVAVFSMSQVSLDVGDGASLLTAHALIAFLACLLAHYCYLDSSLFRRKIFGDGDRHP